jgi:DNA polymerase I-like protein with 3'-5' exonuclease and polymerase domains
MDYSRILCIDFETGPIEPRPKYPPEPVGVALATYASEPDYLAWGHPTENNTSYERARSILKSWWDDPQTLLLFHNAAFDVSVSVERLGLRMPPWHRIHDTQFLLYLYDPHAKSLSLKPSAERLLGWAPEEQDAVHDWLWERRAELKQYNGGKNLTRSKLGAFIAHAPGKLVGRYAKGDVARTLGLFKYLYPRIREAGMEEAYDRERRLLPVLMENERRGLRVDMEGLGEAVPRYRDALVKVEDQMRRYLGASGLSFDNDKDIAAVFVERGVIHEDRWKRTKKSGQLSVSKDNLPPDAFVDPLFASAFGYRNRLVTCLKMFMEPWLEQAQANNGFIHTSWNQVRHDRGGTRSGRPSMTKPNLLNVSKSFDGRTDGYVHPGPLKLPPLPLTREFILPDEGHLWLHRDFNGQEVRIFAHFESGALARAYLQDPMLDPHTWVMDAIERAVGQKLERTRVKNVTFARLYGGGEGAVFDQARCASRAEAKEICAFHDAALPGRKLLNNEIIKLSRLGEPIRTWGGRLYYVEPPGFNKKHNRHMSYEYKLINYLIQGSAADMTKEAICRWYEGGGTADGTRFLLTVYDENNISAPEARWKDHMRFLREIMDNMELDVPMRSTGKVGKRWGKVRECDAEL